MQNRRLTLLLLLAAMGLLAVKSVGCKGPIGGGKETPVPRYNTPLPAPPTPTLYPGQPTRRPLLPM